MRSKGVKIGQVQWILFWLAIFSHDHVAFFFVWVIVLLFFEDEEL